MKKNVLTFALLFVTLCSFAQTAVNKDGTLKFKGNVAIIVNSRYYTFQNGKVIKAVDDEIAKTMKTVLRTLVMEKFQNLGFGIVNRDDEASRQVEELIEENKLEIGEALYKLEKKTVRDMIFKEHKRVDGRALDEIRPPRLTNCML